MPEARGQSTLAPGLLCATLEFGRTRVSCCPEMSPEAPSVRAHGDRQVWDNLRQYQHRNPEVAMAGTVARAARPCEHQRRAHAHVQSCSGKRP